MPYRPVCRGPTVLKRRTTVFGAPFSRCRLWARHSPNAFDVSYTQRALNGEPRTRSESSSSAPLEFLPYTSDVDVKSRRVPCRAAAPITLSVPRVLLSSESSGLDTTSCTPTADARWKHRSASPTSRSTRSASVVEPSMISTRPSAHSPSKFDRVPVVRLSSTTTRSTRGTSASTRWEPMKPAPPGTRTVDAASIAWPGREVMGGKGSGGPGDRGGAFAKTRRTSGKLRCVAAAPCALRQGYRGGYGAARNVSEKEW